MKHGIWGGLSTSKLQNKLHDLAMFENKHPKSKNAVFTVFVAMATEKTHATSL